MVPYEMGSTNIAIVEQSLLERDEILFVLKSNLVLAQNMMKTQDDKRRTET